MMTATGKNRKTTTVRARIEPKLKEDAEQILGKVGLTTSDAIRLFLEQVRLHRGIPFPLTIPTEKTIQALAEVRSNKEIKAYDNVDEMFDSWDL
jgi:DNA-damage-inducible protein J